MERITVTISEERKKRVINLYYNQAKTTREIAKIERMSIRDICPILREEETKRQRLKDQQHEEEISSKAYKLFSGAKHPVEVAIALNLREPETTKLYREYWRLKRLHILNKIYKETNGKLGLFLKLYRLINQRGMTIEQVVNAVEIAIHKLPHMESLYKQLKDEVDKLQYTIQGLLRNIDALKYKISILDKTAFCSEQERKRTEQRVQDLTDKKDRLEKLIADILNGEGYSKLKHTVKEHVKEILSENKNLISLSFAALIQTLKTDPRMVKIIYSIPIANDGEQYKYENNNIAKYLEFNKDDILDLAKKHHENIVKTLTNNAINAAVVPSSNPTLSLPTSMTFKLDPYNESYGYSGKKSAIYDDY